MNKSNFIKFNEEEINLICHELGCKSKTMRYDNFYCLILKKQKIFALVGEAKVPYYILMINIITKVQSEN